MPIAVQIRLANKTANGRAGRLEILEPGTGLWGTVRLRCSTAIAVQLRAALAVLNRQSADKQSQTVALYAGVLQLLALPGRIRHDRLGVVPLPWLHMGPRGWQRHVWSRSRPRLDGQFCMHWGGGSARRL